MPGYAFIFDRSVLSRASRFKSRSKNRSRSRLYFSLIYGGMDASASLAWSSGVFKLFNGWYWIFTVRELLIGH